MTSTERKVWPGETDEAFPDVFTKVPPPPTEGAKPGQLTEEQVKSFFEKGFVVVPDFIDIAELEPCKKDLEAVVEEVAQKLYKGGKIKDLHADKDFFHRMAALEKDWPGATIVFFKTCSAMPESFCKVWSSVRMLNMAEQLLGTSDISGHPVWNIRCKSPRCDVTVVPWHQDAGYMENVSYSVMQVTAWIPFLDTNAHNGGMQMVEGGHRTGKVARHNCCQGNTWYVMLDEENAEQKLGVDLKKDAVTCEVPYGGMLLFNNLLPHRSLDNLSDKVRWSMDLRWTATSSPIGFYGIKQGLPMRSSTDPHMHIDWEAYNKVDRVKAQENQANAVIDDEFDTHMIGPWMGKWEVTNRNMHIDKWQQSIAAKA